MNSLSWFIYATQVVDGLRDTAFGALIALGVLLFFALIFGPLAPDAFFRVDVEEMGPVLKRIAGWVIVAAVCLCLIVILTPSRQTMLLIAGSEVGERLAKSDTVSEIVNPGSDLLKTWIKNETAKLAKEASK